MSLSVPVVSPFGEEFGLVEQELRLQMNAPGLKITELYNISLKPIQHQYNNYLKSMSNPNVVDCFLQVSSLHQSISDIMSHGIRVHPKDGLKVQLCDLSVDKSKEAYEMIHIQVALGNVVMFQDPNAEIDSNTFLSRAPTANDIPNSYNSICVSDRNEYVIFNPAQVNTLHLVRFMGGKNISSDFVPYDICGICGKDNATLYCQNDSIKLCEQCDKKSHSENEILRGHVRVPLLDILPKVAQCPEHPNQIVKHYCPKCHLPVCMKCKVKGSHSSGEAAKHNLISISKAYADAVNSAKRPNPMFVSREQTLKTVLNSTENSLRDIATNQRSVEEEIMRIARKAIESAREQSNKKALAIKSAKLELVRKLNEFMKQKELLETYRDYSEPIPFLESFYRNKLLEAPFAENLDLPPAQSIKGDLVVYGRLEVSPPKIKNAQQESKPKQREPQRGAEYSYYTGYTQDGYTYNSEFDSQALSQSNATLEPPDPQITPLSRMAARKAAKYETQGLNLEFQPFDGSDIISDSDEARKLYMCLPFRGQPQTHLMFSTRNDGRSISKMHRMIDGMGITVVLVRSGTYVFGGFAASKWNSDGVPFGQGSSTFLFSITRDAFVPYKPQSDDPCYLYATPETLSFGKEDLMLTNNFDDCSSSIENSFGVGFMYGSEKAKTFLAGKEKFAADAVEIWGFFAKNE